jgi:S1-C subfamily serine protease
VTLGDGSSGSGFFLNTQSAIYLITARHVLFNPKAQTNPAEQQSDPWELVNNQAVIRSYSRDPTDPTANIMTIDLSLLEKQGMIKHGRDKNKDVVAVRIAEIPTVGQLAMPIKGVQTIQLAKYGVLGVALENVKKFDETLVGNDIFVFGYPSSLGLRNSPQIDYERPLLRKGIIAGKNVAARSLIIDCAVYPGNSGGPVVELDREGFQTHFTVVGVVVEQQF